MGLYQYDDRTTGGIPIIPARLIVLNVCWVALVIWSAFMGYLQFVFTHDVSGISYVIAALLAAALAGAFFGRTGHIARAEVWCVTLGLIGNVVGFILALQNIDVGAIGTPDGVQRVASELLAGMGVAFCSTLVGAVGALWLSTVAWTMGVKGAGE